MGFAAQTISQNVVLASDSLCALAPSASTPEQESLLLTAIRDEYVRRTPGLIKQQQERSQGSATEDFKKLRLFQALRQAEIKVTGSVGATEQNPLGLEAHIPTRIANSARFIVHPPALSTKEIVDAKASLTEDFSELNRDLSKAAKSESESLRSLGINPLTAVSSQAGNLREKTENEIHEIAKVGVQEILTEHPEFLFMRTNDPKPSDFTQATQDFAKALNEESKKLKSLKLTPPPRNLKL